MKTVLHILTATKLILQCRPGGCKNSAAVLILLGIFHTLYRQRLIEMSTMAIATSLPPVRASHAAYVRNYSFAPNAQGCGRCKAFGKLVPYLTSVDVESE